MKRFSKIALTTAIAATIISTGWWLYQYTEPETGENNLPELNELGTKLWSDADRSLHTETFEINNSKDTVLFTSNGSAYIIPSGTFNALPDKPVTIEIREALTTEQILKSGLSTTSNGSLLETGGMFYLNARQNEKSLAFNTGKSITTQLPTGELKPDMKLYSGERLPDGTINWVNPVPIEKPVIPVALNTLNFYPEKFLPVLKELGFDITNKKITDSIYFSYAGRKNLLFDDKNRWGGEIDGQELFNKNCSSCHYASDKKGTGPGLANVLNRIPGGDWKYNYVRNSTAMLASGDAYARYSRQEWGAIMPAFPSLTNQEIDAILNYSSSAGAKSATYQIDPALLAPLSEPQYEGTLIATKEFEKRLNVIFKIGTPEILSLYVNNLNKSFRYIDSLVIAEFPEVKSSFTDFYQLNEGKVEITTVLAAQLQRRYEARSEAVREAAEKVFGKKMQQQAAEDSLERIIQNQEFNGKSQNLLKELTINLNKVYDQLGYKRIETPEATRIKGTAIPLRSLGWHNIDRLVVETTINRKSSTFSDPANGKTASLTYSPFQVTIKKGEAFTQLRVYLISDSLPSYMRLKQSKNIFTEKLNDLLKYHLAVIGKQGEEWYFVEKRNIASGTINVNLEKISSETLTQKLNTLKPKSSILQFDLEMKAMELEETAEIRRKIREKELTHDDAIMKAIFVSYVTPVYWGAKK